MTYGVLVGNHRVVGPFKERGRAEAMVERCERADLTARVVPIYPQREVTKSSLASWRWDKRKPSG